MPGRTTWTFKSGKVMVYNNSKCPTKDSACLENPNSYDTINNPNPMIVIKAKWNTNKVQSKGPGDTTGTPVYPEEKVEKGVRFKDLPKCGQSPIKSTQAQIDEFNKIRTKLNSQIAKSTEEITQAGVGQNTKGPQHWKYTDIMVNNGVSPYISIIFGPLLTPKSLFIQYSLNT